MSQNQNKPVSTPSRRHKVLVLSMMGIWFAFQILFPLRHLLYPGYVSWTEEGHKFSWQMMLRDKEADTFFLVRDPATMVIRQIFPERILMPHQVRKVVGRPDLILQFAHHLAELAEEDGIEAAEVWARACVSLNGRQQAWLVDPLRDLAKVERSWRPADWILPLEHPPARPPIRTGRENLRCKLSSVSR